MLFELLAKFLEPARILVLELHARGPFGIGSDKGCHPLLAHDAGGDNAFLAELVTLGKLGAVAAARNHQRVRALGEIQAKVQGRKASHR